MVEIDRTERTLDGLAALHREALVGRRGMARLGARFPLLVKLIDAAERLSLQVHPDDALARRLYGPKAVGKAEAWLVLEAKDDAELVTGPRRTFASDELLAAVASGELDRDGCEVSPAIPGDAWVLRAGTMHAIGAGTFVYEIEQPSDLTFRISDWGRPPVRGRSLHTVESGLALRPEAHAELAGRRFVLDGGAIELPEFRLELVRDGSKVRRSPDGASLEVVTAAQGMVVVRGPGWAEMLAPFETVVVPASVAHYEIEAGPGALACLGLLP